MPYGMEIGLIQGHIVLDGNPPPLPKRLSSPLMTHVCCGQTAGWIKIPVGTKVSLGPGHILLDRDPFPPRKGAQQPPLFGPCLLWPNGRPSQQLLSSCPSSLRNYNGMTDYICRRFILNVGFLVFDKFVLYIRHIVYGLSVEYAA